MHEDSERAKKSDRANVKVTEREGLSRPGEAHKARRRRGEPECTIDFDDFLLLSDEI
jgi:hypothetical protein